MYKGFENSSCTEKKAILVNSLKSAKNKEKTKVRTIVPLTHHLNNKIFYFSQEFSFSSQLNGFNFYYVSSLFWIGVHSILNHVRS